IELGRALKILDLEQLLDALLRREPSPEIDLPDARLNARWKGVGQSTECPQFLSDLSTCGCHGAPHATCSKSPGAQLQDRGINASTAWSTLKLAAFARGWNSLRLESHSPTTFWATTRLWFRSADQRS